MRQVGDIGADQVQEGGEELPVTERAGQQLHEPLLHRSRRRVIRGIEEGSPEIGVWVSGFYGSGKSSFTKYFGFALDSDHVIGGRPFLEHLQNRFTEITLKQRLSTVAKKHDPVVIMLDLASEMLAGAMMAEISTNVMPSSQKSMLRPGVCTGPVSGLRPIRLM